VPLRVVIAPDSFKGSLDAAAVARAIAEGWRSIRPGDDLVLLPQADGGEGTLAAIAAAIPGAAMRSAGDVTGPDGRPTPGQWLDLPDGTAVVELAGPSGLPLMAAPDPLGATTRGLGEVIGAALDAGAGALVIGLGGSASTDGGSGALAALGMRLLDSGDRPLGDGGGELARLARIDRSGLRAAPAGGVRLLSDVTAPLLGATGAAAVFAPQKGADAGDVVTLDAALANYARLLGDGAAVPGAGAAGGTGYGFLAAWGATIEAGSSAIARLTGLAAEAASADVVITGEGRFDATSTTGKVVGGVLELAGGRTMIVAGQLAAEPPPGVRAWGLTELAGSAEAALDDPVRWLREAGAEAARSV
jgi:glycerate 2-kinase